MRYSSFSGELDMNGLQVQRNLIMSEDSSFSGMILSNAMIGGQVVMRETTFTGRLLMNRLQVKSSFFMTGSTVISSEAIQLTFAEIKNALDLSGSSLPSLDLSNTHIDGELRLGSSEKGAVKWHDNAKLTLRHAKIQMLQDFPDAWPQELELNGFVYSSLESFIDGEKDVGLRSTSSLIALLKRDKSFSPQPYNQLADVLRSGGHSEEADKVLIAKKNNELEATSWPSWKYFDLILLKWTVSYGFSTGRILPWLLCITVIGAFVFSGSTKSNGYNRFDKLMFSLDMLIPFIKLRNKNYDIDIVEVHWYFYFHKIAGYILIYCFVMGYGGFVK